MRYRRAAAATRESCFVRPVGKRSFMSLFLVVLLLTSLPAGVSGQPSTPSQVEVEAVYLFNFTKFVRWPSGHDREPLNICIAADKDYADSTAKVVAGERIGSRPLAVRSVQKPDEIQNCGILFIGESARDRLPGFLSASARQPTLTVSNLPDFIERGGMINLLVLNSRVRFAVNLDPVEKSGLSLSSELLKVAVKVQGNTPGEAIR